MACTCGHGSSDHSERDGCAITDCGCATFSLWTAPARTVACGACRGDVTISFEAGVPQILAAHARDVAAGMAATTCDTCLARELRSEELQRRTAERAEATERRRAASGMPCKWLAQRFDGLEDDPARRRALELAGQWGRGEISGLVLTGPVGRGKTAIAAAAANMRVERGHLRWLAVAELLMDLSAPFDSERREKAVARMSPSSGTAALVLDDLDKVKPTEHAVQPLYVAINAWVEAELPLLVTLNRSLGTLEQWMPDTFGAAISSRLAGYCLMTQVAGADRRLVGPSHTNVVSERAS
jgi:DNA replication protein DnaC